MKNKLRELILSLILSLMASFLLVIFVSVYSQFSLYSIVHDKQNKILQLKQSVLSTIDSNSNLTQTNDELKVLQLELVRSFETNDYFQIEQLYKKYLEKLNTIKN